MRTDESFGNQAVYSDKEKADRIQQHIEALNREKLERLRDEFAMHALAALIGHQEKEGRNRGKNGVPILARFAYEYADAALKAREIK